MDKQLLTFLAKSISAVFLGVLLLSMVYNLSQSVELTQSLVNSLQASSVISVYYLALSSVGFVLTYSK